MDKKTCIWGFRTGHAQTSLLSYQDYIARMFKFSIFQVYRYHSLQGANNKGTDQTVQMCRLVCTVVVYIQQSQVFSRQGLYRAGIRFYLINIQVC